MSELDQEVAREVLWLDLTALLLPEPYDRGFVSAHEDPGVGAADIGATVLLLIFGHEHGSAPWISSARRRAQPKLLS